MTITSSTDEATIRALQQKVALLEQGMKQAAHVRELWGKAVRELKATKAELKESLTGLTAAHQELEAKSISLARLNQQLQEEMALRERMEVELRLAQKLESIGQLAAGIAHEINTPIQYIGDNTRFLSSAFESFLALFERLRPLIDANGDGIPAVAEAIEFADAIEIIRDQGLADLAEDIPDAIAETLEGIQQVSEIVGCMKEFSHHANTEKSPVDINRSLQTTVTVARSEWRSVAEVELQPADDLPKIYAVGAELNQVFLNLLVNAAQAIAATDRAGRGELGLITITTAVDRDGVLVQMADNGTGIPEDIRDRVFDPFFTTRDVGEGSGQGLSIARSIVVDHHQGRIEVTSEPEVGSTFSIWLPITGAYRKSARPAPPMMC